MKRFLLLIAALLLLHSIRSQEVITSAKDTIPVGFSLEEVVISANNFIEKKRNVAQKIDVISANEIAFSNAQNTGDLLINTGKIFVQKSQQGGGSPVIRGFEASRILLVIDGVRMNNAIYRSGHLQNVITNDQNSLNRVEIMYGPSSTIYGSDALGGIIHLITKGPVLSGTKKFNSTGTIFTRYSSANNEKSIHADASLGRKKFAWFQSYNFSDFDDMRMGRHYPDKYPDFGRRTEYIGNINGVDTVLKNTNDRIQKFSGYKQWDIVQKFLYKPGLNASHRLNLQYSTTNNVPRYDRLQDIRNGTLRYAEWYYGPQKRFLSSYEFNTTHLGFADELKVNINYQDIEESRQNRDYRRYDRFESRIEKVKVFGTTISLRKMMERNELTLGLDAQLNDVSSTAFRKNLITNTIASLDTRYPDGKNKMDNVGLFAQHVLKFRNNKLVMNDGLRIQYVTLKSNVEDNSFFNLPDTVVAQKNLAVTGNIGLVYQASKKTNIRMSVSSAFRAPNIDDLAKIFESSTAARQVVLPNANLKPEYTYNVDLSVLQKIGNKLNLELTGYNTLFHNAIIKAPFKLNGQDSILYDGVKSQVLASQNVNKAMLWGFTAAFDAAILKSLSITGNLSYSKGRYKTSASKSSTIYEKQANGEYSLVERMVGSKPLDHIPPLIGKISARYKVRTVSTELYLLFNGWKNLNDYNPDGEDNPQYATKDGMPGWSTLNWKADVRICKNLLLQVGIENIFDRNYRYFASGFSAPGRNFIICIRSSW